MFERLFSSIKQLPSEVKTFLWRAVALFIGWKLLYILVLIPNQVPDAWLVRQLGNGTAYSLNILYGTTEFSANHVTREKVYGKDTVLATFTTVKKAATKNVLGIYQACNGLELMVLYAGFIICFSGSWIRKLIFIIAGVIGLYFINVLRCVFLGYIGLEYPQHFDIAHKYVFNLVVYAFTFFLWVLYVSRLHLKYAKT
jgi:exosortase/archaeosortase family protein